MNFCVINLSGNTGKTTTSSMLKDRNPSLAVYSIESINEGDDTGEQMRGEQYGQLIESVMMGDGAIVDVGSSNVERFISAMAQYRGTHSEFDYFVVPAVRDVKQLKDTVATIMTLQQIGIKANKIKVVFNRMLPYEKVENVFAPLLAMYEEKKNFDLRINAVIEENEIYQQLRDLGETVFSILSNDTDWDAVRREAKTVEEKYQAVRMKSMKGLAASAKENLDACYKALGF
jgi:hypothetical protein